MPIKRRKLDRVDWTAISLHMKDGFHGITSIPKYGLSLIIAGSEDAIMELIEAYFLYFFIVVVEVGKGTGLVALRFAGNVPHG